MSEDFLAAPVTCGSPTRELLSIAPIDFAIVYFVFLSYVFRISVFRHVKVYQVSTRQSVYFLNVYLYYMYFKCLCIAHCTLCKFHRIALNWCVCTTIRIGVSATTLPSCCVFVSVFLVLVLPSSCIFYLSPLCTISVLHTCPMSKFQQIGVSALQSEMCLHCNWCVCRHSCELFARGATQD